MNERERGIAAYKATAAKTGKTRRRRKKEDAGEALSVELSAGPSAARAKEAAAKQASAPGGNDLANERLSAAEKLIRGSSGNKGYRKVAKLLLLLGKDEAARILAHFNEAEVEAISREIATVKRVEKAEAEQLLAEIGLVFTGPKAVKAGVPTAKAMLATAFGEVRADRILKRVLPETRERPFLFLNDIDHHQLLLLLKNESAPTLSVVLPHLAPQRAARVLQSLQAELQKETLLRIAKLKKVDPEVVVSIEGVLKERLRTQGRVVTEEIDGREALANILKHLAYSDEEKILGEIASVDPELSDDVKERLFTIELIFKVDDADLQAVLRDYDDEEIAILLKAKEPRVQEHLLSNLSSRRQIMVKEEMLRLGKMRKSDVDGSTKDFVDYLVELDDQRKISIHWGDQIVE